jgi:hypothetical protein
VYEQLCVITLLISLFIIIRVYLYAYFNLGTNGYVIFVPLARDIQAKHLYKYINTIYLFINIIHIIIEDFKIKFWTLMSRDQTLSSLFFEIYARMCYNL